MYNKINQSKDVRYTIEIWENGSPVWYDPYADGIWDMDLNRVKESLITELSKIRKYLYRPNIYKENKNTYEIHTNKLVGYNIYIYIE